MNKISNWNMWDLHFHLNDTKNEKVVYPEGYDANNIYEYLANKFKEEKISLVVITDHMCFKKESYEKLKFNCPDVAIIPGMEVNVKLEGKEKYVQILIAVNPDDIDKLIEMSNDLENIVTKKGDLSTYCLEMKEFVEQISKMDVTIYWEYGKSRGFDVKKCPSDNLEVVSDYIKYGFLRNYNMTRKPDDIVKRRNELSEYINNSVDKNKAIDGAILFTASDSHYFYADLQDKPWQRTWFKALPTYNGIKMAFTDNKRVCVNDTIKIEDPFNKQKINWIESVEFNINGEIRKIHFSKYLNSIIGSRGMGKSLLLKILNNNIKDDQNKDVVIKDIKLNWINDEGINTVSFYDQNSFIAVGIEQKEELVKKLIDNADEALPSDKSDNFDECNLIIKCWKTIISNFESILTKLNQKYLGDLMSYYYDNSSKLNIKEESDFSKLFNVATILENERTNLSLISTSANSIQERIKVIDYDYKKLKDDIKKIKLDFVIKNALPKQIISENAISDLSDGIKLLQRSIKYMNDNIKIVKEFELGENARNSNNISIISTFNSKKMQTLSNWNAISNFLLRSDASIKKIDQTVKLSFFESTETTTYRVNEQNVTIKKITKYAKDDSVVTELLNQSILSVHRLKYKEIGLKMFNNIEQFKNCLKSNYDKNLTLRNILGDSEFDLTISVGDKEFDAESPGKRAEILLTLLLNDTDTKPLIIDQPEDNLDNRYIADSLCTKIKKLKEQRQVICVSHNANIVINCDSENIITVKNENDIFNFEYGAIEYKDNIENIANYLEGGISALDSRSEKIHTFGGKNIENFNKKG
jgi:ABC-type cobalamin/Fe3+-siderophores transport system ATPase subunit